MFSFVNEDIVLPHAVSWDGRGRLADLGAIVGTDNPSAAMAINDHSTVVGWVIRPGNVEQAILWR